MSEFELFPVGSALRYPADFSDAIPATSPATTLTSVEWTLTPQEGSPLSPALSAQVDDLANHQSSVIVTGCAHDVTYVLLATGTLSDGQVVVKAIALVGLNG